MTSCKQSTNHLQLQIVRGSYAPPSPSFTKGLRDVLDKMLQVDPRRRPSVNDLLKTPVIKERIEKFLSATVR